MLYINTIAELDTITDLEERANGTQSAKWKSLDGIYLPRLYLFLEHSAVNSSLDSGELSIRKCGQSVDGYAAIHR